MAAAARPSAPDPAAANQQVGVLRNRAGARRFDEQAFDRLGIGDEVVEILQEAGSVAVQIERVRKRRKCDCQRCWVWRCVPQVEPCGMVGGWVGRTEQTRQELQRRDAKIRAGPSDVDNRIGSQILGERDRSDPTDAGVLPNDGQPFVGGQIQSSKLLLEATPPNRAQSIWTMG